MTRPAAVRVLILVVVAFALVAAVLVLREALPRASFNAPTELRSAPPSTEAYRAQALAILRPVIDTGKDGTITADVATIAAAKRALMALIVPAEERDQHLAIVLELSRVEQDPTLAEARSALFMQLQ